MVQAQHTETVKQPTPGRVARTDALTGVEQAVALQRAVAPAFPKGGIDPRGFTPQAILALQRTAGNRAVNGLLARHPRAVQRQPQAGAGPSAPAANAALTVGTGSQMVTSAFTFVFENQKTGLVRLHDALQKKSPSNDIVAGIAAVAVGAALTAVLGPVGPAAEALIFEEDVVGRALVKKAADLITAKAVETAKSGVQQYISDAGNKKTDPIANFIESQSLALNSAHEAANQAFLATVDGFNALPGGAAALQAMAKAIDTQAAAAEGLQIAHSAGAWASINAGSGDDAKAWANDDESDAEKGALEIEAGIAAAPLRDPGGIQITRANWRGINKETERVLQERGGAALLDLGVNLRITITTPVGETRCEIPFSQQGNPIIPEKSTLQGVMMWLATGGNLNPSPREEDRPAVESSAAALGYFMLQKPVTELQFG